MVFLDIVVFCINYALKPYSLHEFIFYSIYTTLPLSVAAGGVRRPAYWAPPPAEPYTPNSEEDTNCLGPVEPYAPPMSKCVHIGKKQESPWDGQPPSPAGLSF